MRPAAGISAYLVTTFVTTWGLWLLSQPIDGRSGGGPIFLAGVLAPGLVAVVFTAYRGGRPGVERLVSGIGRWRVGLRWYLFAVGYLVGIKLGAAALQRLVTGSWPPFGDVPWLLVPVALLVSTWVQAGEEIGWRGYLLPRLATRAGLPVASLLVGLVWALWHLPLFYIPGTGSDGRSFPLYLLGVTALSVAMTWLYCRTGGSLLLVMLMHAAVNNTTGVVQTSAPPAATPWTLEGTTAGWLTVGVAWGVALLLLPSLQRTDVAVIVGRPD